MVYINIHQYPYIYNIYLSVCQRFFCILSKNYGELQGFGLQRIFPQQAKLVVVNDLPDPSQERERFEKSLPEQIKRFVGHTDGHAFVLFTSYDLLRRCASAMVGWLAERDLQLYSQAGQQNRTQLLDAFRRNPRGVLFGTDSFWQGVDVPGEALSNVVITKLPFAVPNHPLLEGVDLPPTGKPTRSPLLLTKTLLFQGEGPGGDPVLWVRDKTTGQALARIDLPGSVTGVPMTYMVEGRQYLAMAVSNFRDPARVVVLALAD